MKPRSIGPDMKPRSKGPDPGMKPRFPEKGPEFMRFLGIGWRGREAKEVELSKAAALSMEP